jgi:ABC-type uncharacterized transport system permease subunit
VSLSLSVALAVFVFAGRSTGRFRVPARVRFRVPARVRVRVPVSVFLLVSVSVFLLVFVTMTMTMSMLNHDDQVMLSDAVVTCGQRHSPTHCGRQ